MPRFPRSVPALVLSAIALAAWPPGSLAAQQGPPPGCTTPEFRQFDYWIGDWEVTDSAGRVVMGTSSVTLEEQGCVIHEHWAGSRGGTGQSFNYWDPRAQRWQQDWVASSAGSALHLIGHLVGNTMTLEADVPGPNNTTIRQQVQWIPQSDGRVRQYWRTSNDAGATWKVSFDGWYRRKS